MNDGGAAFPRASTLFGFGRNGMTMRQWYAGHALAGLLANPRIKEDKMRMPGLAIEIADAMIDGEEWEKT